MCPPRSSVVTKCLQYLEFKLFATYKLGFQTVFWPGLRRNRNGIRGKINRNRLAAGVRAHKERSPSSASLPYCHHHHNKTRTARQNRAPRRERLCGCARGIEFRSFVVHPPSEPHHTTQSAPSSKYGAYAAHGSSLNRRHSSPPQPRSRNSSAVRKLTQTHRPHKTSNRTQKNGRQRR